MHLKEAPAWTLCGAEPDNCILPTTCDMNSSKQASITKQHSHVVDVKLININRVKGAFTTHGEVQPYGTFQ